ncbi:hypothetical protein SFHH103_psfHH103d_501 (plasmid) [Sinorhizobium fredii HH103]|nr:hypothetical protein SFHH103_04549 [Sinorhizobium fredii HH103]CEO91708.1 hypothetical protein SFHH103_psfHH103d_501 [Sinorhizobium fredii HH103]
MHRRLQEYRASLADMQNIANRIEPGDLKSRHVTDANDQFCLQ